MDTRNGIWESTMEKIRRATRGASSPTAISKMSVPAGVLLAESPAGQYKHYDIESAAARLRFAPEPQSSYLVRIRKDFRANSAGCGRKPSGSGLPLTRGQQHGNGPGGNDIDHRRQLHDKARQEREMPPNEKGQNQAHEDIQNVIKRGDEPLSKKREQADLQEIGAHRHQAGRYDLFSRHAI